MLVLMVYLLVVTAWTIIIINRNLSKREIKRYQVRKNNVRLQIAIIFLWCILWTVRKILYMVQRKLSGDSVDTPRSCRLGLSYLMLTFVCYSSIFVGTVIIYLQILR